MIPAVAQSELPSKYRGIPKEAILLDVRRELARRHVFDLTTYTFPGYRPAPHNRLLCQYLDQWVSGEITRLMVFMPPRHGKSELVSRRLPAYILGRYPSAQVLAVSYGQGLANSLSRETKAILTSRKYQEVFPGVRLSRTPNAVDEWKTTGHGVYKCAGVRGGITGRGFDFGIIDDPVKNRMEAESETIRQAVWDWYTSTFYTRQQPGARILITQTRWHEDDLSGRLVKAQQEDPHTDTWTVLQLPAIAEANDPLGRLVGEPLWPQRFPKEKLVTVKANIGSYDWQALYQQRPAPPGGSKIKPSWFKIRDKAPEGLSWVRYWDLAVSAKKTADFTASAALAMSDDGDVFIRDMIRGQWIWPETRKIMVLTARTEEIPIGIESAGQQQGFVDELTRDPDLAAFSIKGVRPMADKLTRALPWIARAEAGQVYLIRGSWVTEFLGECARFTGKNDAQDDQIDCVSGAYQMVATSGPKMFWI
ncbi:MAG: phage terminase large subunit [Deltaproteobacteria bacterium]|nr:phage terminase large subunit [Deltaproteobacteria bacterium]